MKRRSFFELISVLPAAKLVKAEPVENSSLKFSDDGSDYYTGNPTYNWKDFSRSVSIEKNKQTDKLMKAFRGMDEAYLKHMRKAMTKNLFK